LVTLAAITPEKMKPVAGRAGMAGDDEVAV